MAAKNFAWSPHINHAFGLSAFNAYSLSVAKTLCGVRYNNLSDDETMTSSCIVSCLWCVRARLSR